MKKKLVAVLACRNSGQRLYAKPLQNLDIKKKIKIIDQIIFSLKTIKKIKQIILAISDEKENVVYERIAKEHKIRFIYGDKINVLGRLIKGAKKTNATDVFRVTTESPFIYLDNINSAIDNHYKKNADASLCWNMIDGTGFEIIKTKTLILSHKLGSKKHRSELCTLYIRENIKKFKVLKIYPPKKLVRKDLRLTVDYPEDLIICRKIYNSFKKDAPKFKISKIVKFLDNNKFFKNLVSKYTKLGYKNMY